jgi:hypothetical protein
MASADSAFAPGADPADTIPAFPEARGAGAIALNQCRDSTLAVHFVDSLTSSGPGSLDSVINELSSANLDVIIFRQGGRIGSGGTKETFADCVIMAGQTAPGDGVNLFFIPQFRNAYDIVVSYLGMDEHSFYHEGGRRFVYTNLMSRWRVSRYLLRTESVITGDALEYGTIMNGLFYEPDTAHVTQVGIAGPGGTDSARVADLRTNKVDLFRTAILGPGRRAPLVTGYSHKVMNNVIYNWIQRGSKHDRAATVDWLSNYHKAGPGTDAGSATYRKMPFVVESRCADLAPDADSTITWTCGSFFSGNRNDQNSFVASSDSIAAWEDPTTRYVGCRDVYATATYCADGDTVPDSLRRVVPLGTRTGVIFPYEPVFGIPDTTVTNILNTAGNYRRLACDGSWVNIRSSEDSTRIAWFNEDAVPAAAIAKDTMSLPSISAGTPCAIVESGQGKGLYKEWLNAYGMDSSTAGAPPADSVLPSGYLLIESMLWGFDPGEPEDFWNNAAVDSIPFRGAADDTLGRLPGGVGWGNIDWECRDSVRAGSGSVYLWDVTSLSDTVYGTYPAAIDSVEANNSYANCHDIVFRVGGELNHFRTISGGGDAYSNLYNIRISGQAASGEGVNVGDIRTIENRGGSGRIFEFFRIRGVPFGSDPGLENFFKNRCVSRQYVRHVSVAWASKSGADQIQAAECATETVQLDGDTTWAVTAEYNLMFEPDQDHATSLAAGATGMGKTRNILYYRNYMGGPGRRQFRFGGEVDTAVAIENVSYNHQNHAASVFHGRHDVINYLAKEGPRTDNDQEGQMALLQADVDSAPDHPTWSPPPNNYYVAPTMYISNIQGERNSYEVDAPFNEMVRGATRVVGCQGYGNWCTANGDSVELTYFDSIAPIANAYDSAFMVTPISGWDSIAIDSTIYLKAGMSRQIDSTGLWGAWGSSRDSVDDRAFVEFYAGTGVNILLNTDTARAAGDPAAGAAPSDADGDGLPDAYESSQCGTSTCIPSWGEWVNGRWAGDWYLNGCNLDGTLVGERTTSCGAGSLYVGASFGAVLRYVYFVPMTTSFGVQFPQYDSIQNIAYGILNPSEDSMMVVSCNQDAGTVADSANIHGRVVAWNRPGINTATLVRDFTPFTGMAC